MLVRMSGFAIAKFAEWKIPAKKICLPAQEKSRRPAMPECLSDEKIRELQDPDRNGPIVVAMALEIEAWRTSLSRLEESLDALSEVTTL